ncbi:MAG: hypothetical protein NZL93_03410 [Chthoniobacterales bacterium]|nr:hypothetical protein [Chthoniobacterales bacterium]
MKPDHLLNPEDRCIRNLIFLVSSATIAVFFLLGITITILISLNFNILEWME